MNLSWGNPYESPANPLAAAWAAEWERTTFIRRTYLHLAGAIGLFVLIEFLIFSMFGQAQLANMVAGLAGGWNWAIVLGAFILVSWVANAWASSANSIGIQYLGLGLYVVAEAVIFTPLLFIASLHAGGSLIPAAGLMTGVIFTGLTGLVLTTRADFSWLGKYLCIAAFAALGLILCSIFLGGMTLGVLFAAAMIVLASGYILYDTSNVLHHYRTDQYVAASLALFASVALLFWYILRLMMSLNRE